jgi:hypothetical protein
MPKLPKRDMTYIGIDPGASGGLCVWEDGTVDATPMPKMDRELWEWFEGFGHTRPVVAIIEKVGGYQGDNQPGSRMFNFGMGYGKLLMALTAADIPFEEVTPQKWQKALGLGGRGKASKTEWKNKLLQAAQRLHPHYPLWKQPRTKGIQLSVCDAILLATYCQRKATGTI